MKRKIVLLALIPLLASCGNEKPVDPTPTPTPDPIEEKEGYGPSKNTYYYLTRNNDFCGNFSVTYSEDFKTITETYVDGSRCITKLNDKYNFDRVEYYYDEEDSTLLTGYSTYEYNSAGLKTCVSDYSLKDNVMVLFYTCVREYDEQGREVNVLASYLNDETGTVEPNYEYKYKYEGNTSYELYFYYGDGYKDFQYCYKTIEEIDEKNNELKNITYYTENEDLTGFEFSFSEIFDLKTGLILRNDYFEGDNIPCSFVYTYNKNGDLLKCHDTGSNLTRINEYVYDEETGFLKSSSYSTIENSTGVVLNKRTDTYKVDENGVVTETHMVQEYYGVIEEEVDYFYENIGANYYLPFDGLSLYARFPGHYTD